jgi:hypothetical protein
MAAAEINFCKNTTVFRQEKAKFEGLSRHACAQISAFFDDL